MFCVNDLVAFGLIDYVRRHTKLRVPNDLSVIGFDDIPEAAWDAYNLTTFKQDASVMAAHAVALLDRRDAEPDHPPVHERLTTRLIERGSARLLHGHSDLINPRDQSMKIIQVTDLHLVTPGETLCGLDPLARLQACIADINRNNDDAALVIFTGDLSETGDEVTYRALSDELGKLIPPFRLNAR